MASTPSTPQNDEVPLSTAAKRKMRAHLGFDSNDELMEFLDGPLIDPDFKMFFTNCVEPLRKKAQEDSGSRRRGPTFHAYEALLIADDCGQQQYQDTALTDDDYGEFSEPQWYCWLISRIVSKNSTNRRGLWYKRDDIRIHKKRCVAWSILQFKCYLAMPSRQALENRRRANKGKRKSAAKSGPSQGRDDGDDSEGFGDFVDPDALATLEDDARFVNQVVANGGDINDNDAPDADRIGAVHAMLAKSTNDARMIDQVVNGRARPLTLGALMLFQCKHKVFNPEDRYWRWKYSDSLIENTDQPELIGGFINEVQAQMDDALNAEDQDYHKRLIGIGDDDELPYSVVSEDDTIRWHSNSRLVDNPRYHYDADDYRRSCRTLAISTRAPRFPCMPASLPFKFWQPAGIAWLRKMESESGLRGCLLADVMGLGKTWVIIGFCIKTLMTWRGKKRAGQEAGPAKPTLIITLPACLDQFAREIAEVSGSYFRVLKYKGTYTQHVENPIKGRLTPDHSIFDPDSDVTAKTIVITTARTLAHRHGPSALRDSRLATGVWTEAAAQGAYDRQAERGTWIHDLRGKFGYVIVDEAHTVKNVDTSSHKAVLWLEPKFTILATGTPDANRAEDLLGLVRLIEAPQDVLEQTLRNSNVDAGFMPYNGTDGDHSLAIRLLRASSACAEKYILGGENSKDPYTQGKRLADLQQAIMLKRTFASEIARQGKIGDDIPALRARNITFAYTKEETTKYMSVAKGPSRKLIRIDAKSGKVLWNFAAVRQLLLYSLWPGFVVLQAELSATKCGELLIKASTEHHEDRMFLVNWLLRKYGQKTHEDFTEFNDVAKLAFLLVNAPKMRGLVSLLRDHVFLRQEKVLLYASVPAQMVSSDLRLWTIPWFKSVAAWISMLATHWQWTMIT